MTRGAVLRNLASGWFLVLIITGTQLLQVPIALRALSKEEFGLFAVLSQLVTVLMYVEMGVSAAFSRLLIDARAEGPARFQSVWSSGVVILGMQCGFLLLAVGALSLGLNHLFHIPPHFTRLAPPLFAVVGGLMVFRYGGGLYNIALFSGQRLAVVNLLQCAGLVLQLLLFAVAVSRGFGLWAYAAGTAGLSLVTVSGGVIVARLAGLAGSFRRADVSRAEVRKIFTLGLDVFVTNFFAVFMQSAPMIFAGMLLPLAEVAVLAVNMRLALIVITLLQRVPGSAEPVFMGLVSHGEMERFQTSWRLLAKLTLTGAAVLAGLLYFWSALVVRLWTSPEMIMSVAATAWLCLLPVRFVLHYFAVNQLLIFKALDRVRLALVAEAAVCTGLVWVLTPRFGASGLLASFVCSISVGAFWRGAWVLAGEMKMPVKNLLALFFRAVLPPVMAVALFAACTGGWRPAMHGWPSAGAVLLSLAWVGICAGYLWWLVLDFSQRAAFREALEKASPFH